MFDTKFIGITSLFFCLFFLLYLMIYSFYDGNISDDKFVAKYSIEFPDDWKVMKGIFGGDIIAIAPNVDPEDLFRENANIITDQLSMPLNRDQYYSLNVESLSQLLEDFDLENTKDVNINGMKARKIIFTHTMGIINTKVIQYLIIDGKSIYVINFTADNIDFDKYSQKFEAIAQTFKIES